MLFLPRTWHNRATDAKFKEKGKEREKLEERNGERGEGSWGRRKEEEEVRRERTQTRWVLPITGSNLSSLGNPLK